MNFIHPRVIQVLLHSKTNSICALRPSSTREHRYCASFPLMSCHSTSSVRYILVETSHCPPLTHCVVSFSNCIGRHLVLFHCHSVSWLKVFVITCSCWSMWLHLLATVKLDTQRSYTLFSQTRTQPTWYFLLQKFNASDVLVDNVATAVELTISFSRGNGRSCSCRWVQTFRMLHTLMRILDRTGCAIASLHWQQYLRTHICHLECHFETNERWMDWLVRCFEYWQHFPKFCFDQRFLSMRADNEHRAGRTQLRCTYAGTTRAEVDRSGYCTEK